MDYDELIKEVAKQVHVRYGDYVKCQESKFITVDSFDEVAEQLLDEVLDDHLIYTADQWTIIQATCDDCSELFLKGSTTFDRSTPYDAFRSDCLTELDIY